MKGPKTLQEINNPDDHYPLPRLNYLGAIVGNGRHRNYTVKHVACARMRNSRRTLALMGRCLKNGVQKHMERIALSPITLE